MTNSEDVLKKAIIVDVDKTLVNCPSPPPGDYSNIDWETVVKSTIDSPPFMWCVQLIHAFLDKGFEILLITSRHDSPGSVDVLMRWLSKNVFRNESDAEKVNLLMRNAGDLRPDELVKLDLYHTYVSGVYDVLLAIDDKIINCELWRNKGIPSLLVV